MNNFDMRNVEVSLTLMCIGFLIAFVGLVFELGEYSTYFIGFGLTTFVFNAISAIYKIRKWNNK